MRFVSATKGLVTCWHINFDAAGDKQPAAGEACVLCHGNKGIYCTLIGLRVGVRVKAWFAPLDETDKGGNLALRFASHLPGC